MENPHLQAIRENIAKKIVGNTRTLNMLLTAFLSEGHVLLEDMPGSGKTALSKAIAQSVNLTFGRIQFTPDLLPTDITGMNVFDQEERKFIFHPGPVFCNILLADEINRATPRTQAGLLECMEERQVTTDGSTRPLEAPFLVVATQNPLETAGTFPLPEAQMDRFFMQLSMDTMPTAGKKLILQRANDAANDSPLTSVCSRETLISMQKESRNVYTHPDLIDYIVAIVEETGNIPGNRTCVSHRGMLAFHRAAKTYAYLEGRDYVSSEDIKAVAIPVLAHRVVFDYGMGGTPKKEACIKDLLDKVPVPTEQWKTNK